MTLDVYKQNGFKSRPDYLRALSDDYGVPLDIVLMLAQLLGPNEDFDGLVIAVDDYSDYGMEL